MTVLLHLPVQAPVETEVVTDADVLRRAAYLLDEEIVGWCQGSLAIDRNGYATYAPERGVSVCLYGVILKANVELGGDPEDSVGDVLDLVRRDGASIGEWNDAPGRTREEVIARLRDAAEKASS